jgi:lipopolysaccharide/colanic/teichoic acid biosynthesis glycosyltransferase
MPLKGVEYLQSADKRRLDLYGGIALAAAVAPVGIVSTGAAMAASRSMNPLFVQRRLGQNDEEFNAFKLRSLRAGLTQNDEDAARALGTFDPRATTLGRLLRASGVDEAPQVYNVIKGQMSLVGPRPVRESALDNIRAADPALFDEWRAMCTEIKPGLIGLSQIYRHHYRINTPELYAASMRMDLDYIETATLGHDLKLMGSFPIRLALANIGVVDNQAEVPGEDELLLEEYALAPSYRTNLSACA